MKTRYSKKTGVFYPLDIDYPTLPDDIIEVPISDFNAAMARPDGHTFDFINGKLVITPPPAEPQAFALERAIVDIRKQRAVIMNTLDGISGRMYRKGEIELSQAADDAIEALLDITDMPQLLAAATYDEMKAVVLARYRQIAAAAPDIVKAAFVEAVAP